MAVRLSPIKFRHTPVLNSCNDAKGRRIETLRLSEFHSKGAIPWWTILTVRTLGNQLMMRKFPVRILPAFSLRTH